MITILVAYNRFGVIGRNGKMPWHLPEDMRMFKERTTGNVVIMGRKTWDSLPNKPLPGRVNIVLSKRGGYFPGAAAAFNLEEAIAMACDFDSDKEIFIIGGAQVYKSALEAGVVDRMLISWVNDDSRDPEDVHFPLPVDGEGWFLHVNEKKIGDYDGFQLWEYTT